MLKNTLADFFKIQVVQLVALLPYSKKVLASNPNLWSLHAVYTFSLCMAKVSPKSKTRQFFGHFKLPSGVCVGVCVGGFWGCVLLFSRQTEDHISPF